MSDAAEQADEQLKALRAEWYAEARKQTTDTLAEFIGKLAAHPHDYNTICYATAAAALAAAHAMDHSPNGGITGFQGGAIMWEFVTEWLGEQNKPLKLVRYENLLYPQYAGDFAKTISQETADWLKEEAVKRLADQRMASPAVIAHWEMIAAGKLPFGFRVKP